MSEPVDLAAVRMFVRAALVLGRDPRETFDMLYVDEREALLRHAVMPRPRPRPRPPKPVDPAPHVYEWVDDPASVVQTNE